MRGCANPIVGLITQTVVDTADPAFAQPTKFVGPVYTPDPGRGVGRRARLVRRRRRRWLAAGRGIAGTGAVIEEDSITALVGGGAVVICGGGGGAAVTADVDGRLTGVEAVVDKDFIAALLGVSVGADGYSS